MVPERGPRVPEPQRPGRQGAGVEGGVDGGQCRGGPVPEGAAFGRQLQVVGGAVDQSYAQVVLELTQGTGEGGLPGVQPGRGARDRALLGDREEGPQVAQFHGHACQA